MVRIGEILEKVRTYLPESGVDVIQKAYVFSAAAHAGQTRRSGEPYLSHPLEVANVLADMRLDEATIAAGLLHDTVEDTKVSIEEIDEEFGEEVGDIVEGVTKISQMPFETKEQAQAENIRKMILSMAENMRVLIVKLADRLHNMRTMEHMPAPKQKAISQETMDIYAPLANRLGLHRLKLELEDLALKYLKPDVYNQLCAGVEKYQVHGKDYIEKVVGLLNQMLEENEIPGRVTGRTKHVYSIYHKMVQQNLTLDQVYDIIAFRVILKSIKDCYAMLGLVHAAWRPVPGRFKDYISMPKANMYQSLHTTVIGPDGERIEIQIRTEEMHQLAEYGVAAHWRYKDKAKVKSKEAEQFSWLRQILDWQKQESDSREFMRSLRFDLFKDEVYVFTPRGDVKELPEGATPVDFAYLIHSEVGDHCAGGKVNGKLVPLSTPLKNGDTVEIITDKQRTPSRDWLKFVKTAKARTRIHHYLRTEERARAIALAKELLEKEGRKMGVNAAKALKEGVFEDLAREFSFKGTDDLLTAVGYARITPRKVLNKLQPARPKSEEKEKHREKGKPAETRAEMTPEETRRAQASEHVSIKGVDDVLVRFAGCCNPLPGDTIVGYISRGRGVTVHTADCPNVQNVEPERIIPVSWGGDTETPYPAKIRLICKNRRGVLGRVASLLAQEGVNIDAGHFHSTVDGNTEIVLTIEVKEAAMLYVVLEKLSALDDILEASRMTAPTRSETGRQHA
ncbi:GTP pyrophosphokinase [Oceanidesulfovibrio indonesiensis]|uniref:GTP pyrophosphokinase n=1 Tax=Oceanidesulfovibrio indonesiensis TaxID=54767 RepID=A0A7M3MFX9_9BACT|nr:bifunctional (p)ppGpp synthetase/guanosine-3',5'-bis(diphosphate) 3'-pyrophosphohydrolase [Oceanidesulfovibrio indonesiensis]TVM17423.1 GTP pyrophosphokinase [Oceanidesulfovibrio indonesiensis]